MPSGFVQNSDETGAKTPPNADSTYVDPSSQAHPPPQIENRGKKAINHVIYASDSKTKIDDLTKKIKEAKEKKDKKEEKRFKN